MLPFPGSLCELCTRSSGSKQKEHFFWKKFVGLEQEGFPVTELTLSEGKENKGKGKAGQRLDSVSGWQGQSRLPQFLISRLCILQSNLTKLFLKYRKQKSRNVGPWKCRIKTKPKSGNKATSTEVVICIEEAFAGGFPLLLLRRWFTWGRTLGIAFGMSNTGRPERDSVPRRRWQETLVLTFTLKRVCTKATHSFLAEDMIMPWTGYQLSYKHRDRNLGWFF